MSKKLNILTISLGGSYKGFFKNVNDGWNIEGGIFPEWLAKKIINDVNPKYNTDGKPEIGVKWPGYNVWDFFGEAAGGGFIPNRKIKISNELLKIIQEKFK